MKNENLFDFKCLLHENLFDFCFIKNYLILLPLSIEKELDYGE